MSAADSGAGRRFSPRWPSWARASTVTCILLLLGAAVTAHGRPLLPWHIAVAAVVAIVALGSWRGQMLSTSLRYWLSMARRNRRGHPVRARHGSAPADDSAAAAAEDQVRIVVQVRPQPHRVVTADDAGAQLPWATVLSWLDRYGVCAESLDVTAVTRTPPASGLRRDVAPLVTARTPQHRDCWISYTLRAADNIGALRSRRIDITELGTITARRLGAEMREQGWLATICDDPDALPRFVSPDTGIRRECWTATEYADGFRAVYDVHAEDLDEVLQALPSLPARVAWTCVSFRAGPGQAATLGARIGVLTSSRPVHTPLPGLLGLHGRHHDFAPQIGATGFGGDRSGAAPVDLGAFGLTWPVAATGVPLGTDRHRRVHYLGLASPEPVRVTVVGSPEFSAGIVARLALSGLPVAIYARGDRWQQLANHAGPQQVRIAPATAAPGSIVVTDDSVDVPAPAGAISVVLRRPQAAKTSTTIVITQSREHPELFDVATARGRQRLSTRLM